MVDNIKIMKKFAKTQNTGLLDIYKKEGIKELREVKQTIKKGIFTLDEYYQMVYNILENADIEMLDEIQTVELPIRFHPRLYIFDKLILRYIGYSDIRDIRLFDVLVILYTQKVSSYKKLFNLIYDTYFINSIVRDIYEILYQDLLNELPKSYKIWINDNIEEFKEKPKVYIKEINDFIEESMEQYNEHDKGKELCYTNSKILDWILTNYIVNNREDDQILHFLSLINLSLEQFKLCLQNINDRQFYIFFEHFTAYNLSYPDFLLSRRLLKMELLIKDSRFSQIPRGILRYILSHYINMFNKGINRDISVFLRERTVSPLINFDIDHENPKEFTLG